MIEITVELIVCHLWFGEQADDGSVVWVGRVSNELVSTENRRRPPSQHQAAFINNSCVVVPSGVGFCSMDDQAVRDHNRLELEAVHLFVSSILASLVVPRPADRNLLRIQTPGNRKVVRCTLISESFLVRSPTNRIFVSKHKSLFDSTKDHRHHTPEHVAQRGLLATEEWDQVKQATGILHP